MEANKNLIFKAQDILFKYNVETFRFAMYCFMDATSQRDKNLFDLFFYSFMLEVRKCLKENKQCQSEEEFCNLFEKYDLFRKLSHFAGTPNNTEVENQGQNLEKTEQSEDNDNEHYDPDFYRT